MAFIKDESEDMKIEETFRVKHEDTEEQTKKAFVKEESEDARTEDAFRVKQEDTEEQTGQPDLDRCAIRSSADIVRTVVTMADHGYKCYVPDCAGDVNTFHTLPTEKNCQKAWLMFIYNRIPQHFNSKLLVCSAHFTMDSFSNLGQYQAGFAQRLKLKKGIIPTILPLQPLPQATKSQLQRTSDVGCQTDDPIVFSKGTQLSLKTLRSHLRSKGVQVTSTTEMSLPTIQPVTSTTVKASRPAKRSRVELEEDMEMEDVSFADPDPQDFTHDSVTAETESSSSPQVFATSVPSHKESKFIVFEKCLLSLFESCPVCTKACNVRPRRIGTFIAIDQLCPHCDFFRQWRSQPVIGSTPVGNLQLSAAIYFSGASFLKMQKVFRAMYLKTHTYDDFRRHARTYLEPAIIHKWNEDQNVQLHDLSKNKNIILGGDMQADLPGHSAKYGSYTMMDLQTNNVIDIQLVQSNKVGGSYHMKEGLRRSLDLLEKSGVKPNCIVTDRQPQIQKFLKDCKLNHHYDVWHMAKRLSKKVKNISREKDCSLVKKWHKSIINHLYWSATSSDSGPEKLAKWTSVINHIQDIHTHSEPAFPRCQHEQRVSKDRSKWFQPGSTALNRLRKVLINKRVLSDVEKLSPHYQTSTVESFHKAILDFAPKNAVSPFIGMLCRLYLAAMHFNENSVRPQMTTSEGKLVYKPFPKAKKGGHAIKPVKTEPTFYLIALKEERQELMKIEEEDQYERFDFAAVETSILTETTLSQKEVQKTESNSHFSCNQCGRRFNHKCNLKTHMRIHTGEKPFTCQQCGKSFRQKQGLDSHMKHHTGEKPFICQQCGKSFSSKENLKYHMNHHTGEKPFICQQCGKSFSRKLNLKYHMKSHTGEKHFTCQQCGKSFDRKQNLKSHIKIHTGEKPFTCQQCGKSFIHAGNLNSHMKIHTGEKPFTCQQCGKSFRYKQRFNSHMICHTGENPFTCDQCGKSFRAKVSLNSHTKREHPGENGFICHWCGKGFNCKVNLQTHLRVHTGEKAFICKQCGKGFTYKAQFDVHMRTHTGEKPFTCKLCGKSFSQKGSVSAHMKTHTGEKPFTCDQCGKSFRKKVSLNSHINREHPGENSFVCYQYG